MSEKVSIVMGSQSDYKTMKFAVKVLKTIGVKFDVKIIWRTVHQKECMIFQ